MTPYASGYIAEQECPPSGYACGTHFVCLSTNRLWLLTENGWLYLGSFAAYAPPSTPFLRPDP